MLQSSPHLCMEDRASLLLFIMLQNWRVHKFSSSLHILSKLLLLYFSMGSRRYNASRWILHLKKERYVWCWHNFASSYTPLCVTWFCNNVCSLVFQPQWMLGSTHMFSRLRHVQLLVMLFSQDNDQLLCLLFFSEGCSGYWKAWSSCEWSSRSPSLVSRGIN